MDLLYGNYALVRAPNTHWNLFEHIVKAVTSHQMVLWMKPFTHLATCVVKISGLDIAETGGQVGKWHALQDL